MVISGPGATRVTPRASDIQPRGLAHRAICFVVIAGRRLDRPMLGLLHGLGQGDALPSGLRQISGAQSVRGKRLRLQACHGAAA
jgi:hypothetical protein